MTAICKNTSPWKKVTISSLCNSLSYGTSQKSKPMGKYAVLRMGNLQSGFIDWSDLVFTDDEYDIKKYNLAPGDILFNRTNSPDLVGKTSIYRGERPAIYAGYLIKLDYDHSKVIGEYLNYILNSPAARRYCLEVKTDGVSQSNINAQKIGNFQFYLPSYGEQQEIVDVISDMDELIASLNNLITKKKAIKQGTMQELLTGKKRLPGFSGDWKEFNFGSIFTFIPNNAFTRAEMSETGSVKNIHYGDILTKYGSYVEAGSPAIPYLSKSVDISRFTERNYVQSGDIIMADTAEDETVGKALEIINVTCKILAGQHTLLCRPKIQFAPKFLGYYLNADCYHEQFLSYIVGTKVSSVSKTSVSKTTLIVPCYEEQQTIASILSDMDAEIEALERKLAKCHQTKQGMMQQLLTGKIRLV